MAKICLWFVFQNPYRKVIAEEGNVSSTTAEEEEEDEDDRADQRRRMASNRNMNGHSNGRHGPANGPRAKSVGRLPPGARNGKEGK